MTGSDDAGAGQVDRAAASMVDALHGWLRALGDGDLAATRRHLADIVRLTPVLSGEPDYRPAIERYIGENGPLDIVAASACAVELVTVLGVRIVGRLRDKRERGVAGSGAGDGADG